jgi:pyruvate dehydrogenase kinase 2/3/4
LEQLFVKPNVQQIAELIHREVPQRFAYRMRRLDELPKRVPEFEEIKENFMQCFKNIRSTDPSDHTKLTSVISGVRRQLAGIVPLFSTGIRQLTKGEGKMTAREVDLFADDFFLTRISNELLMSQFMSLRKGGSILEKVNPVNVVEIATDHVASLCDDQHGGHPEVVVVDRCKGASLMLPPQYLYYVLIEILKNSMQAMMKQREKSFYTDDDALQVVVCSDAERVVIAVRDKGGGIPLQEIDKIWSYLYTTALTEEDSQPTALAGYGFGLPLSRLYAKYLGSAIEVQSMPGYGTDVYLTMSRTPFPSAEVQPTDIQDIRNYYDDFFFRADGSSLGNAGRISSE